MLTILLLAGILVLGYWTIKTVTYETRKARVNHAYSETETLAYIPAHTDHRGHRGHR